MITILHHEADRVILDATRVLRELSAAGLLADIALVPVGVDTWSGQPPATCVRAGQDTHTGLFDALAIDPATDGRVMTAVASADLAPQAQLELAEALRDTTDTSMQLAGVPVAASCLYVPQASREGGILPASGFFAAGTANFIALPTDWRFVDADAVAIDFNDADRAAWHAAFEIVTLTSAWHAVSDSRWHQVVEPPGVAGFLFRFVRSSARLVTVRPPGLAAAAQDVLPVPDGFTAAPVPEMVERTVRVLHPDVFRLDSQLGGPGAADQRGAVLRLVVGAFGRLFPPLASGLRGFWRLLRTEVARALGGDAGSAEGDQPQASVPDRQAADAAAVVLEGFDPKVWTDLVRNVLGVADGGGTVDAGEARRVAGHKQFVFVTRDCLVDDVLENRVHGGATDSAAAGDVGPAYGDAEAAAGVPEPVASAAELAGDGMSGSGPAPPRAEGGADPAEGSGGPDEGGASLAEPTDPDPVEGTGRPRGLLTFVDDAFRREIARAKTRRRYQQRELKHLAEQAERIETFEPPAALRTTIMAFFITAYVVLASYVLLRDNAFDFLDVDTPLGIRLAAVAAACAWLVLRYPVAPRDDDPHAVQLHLLRSAAFVAVVAALAAVFADRISDIATDSLSLHLIPIFATVVTVWLAWKVLRSERASERPAGRALALTWAICYLIAGLLLYANMDSSVFSTESWLRGFFEDYGGSLRFAAIAVAGFLLLLVLAMLAVSDAGADRGRRRARARMRQLHQDLQREELVPLLMGLRVNWLGTAAAIDYILRRGFPPPSAPGGDTGVLRTPLLRLAVRSHQANHQPSAPGWLFALYETAVDAYHSRGDARTTARGWVRPETATMVSRLDSDPLEAPGTDPRWDFAHRLRAGEFDDALLAGSAGAGDESLRNPELQFMGEIAPVAPAALPLGVLGPGAASLGQVAMHSMWWWPDGFDIPESLNPPRPARSVPSAAGQAYLAVRLDVSDPVLGGRPDHVSAPPAEPDDGSAPADSDDGLR